MAGQVDLAAAAASCSPRVTALADELAAIFLPHEVSPDGNSRAYRRQTNP